MLNWREYRSLKPIDDNFDKYVVSMDDYKIPTNEGIEHSSAWNLDGILSEWFLVNYKFDYNHRNTITIQIAKHIIVEIEKFICLKWLNRSLKIELQIAQKEREKNTDKLRTELRKIYGLFPNLRELLSIERICRLVGFSDDLTKRILTGNKVGFKGSLYSAEYKRKFSTEHSVAQM